MMARTLALAWLTLFATSCVSDPELVPPPAQPPGDVGGGDTTVKPTTPPPSAPAGQKFFVTEVHPKLQANCGNCHSVGANGAPIWLDPDGNRAYQLITEYGDGALVAPASRNRLLTKGPHYGAELEADEQLVVEQWLEIENPGENGGVVQTADQLLKKFSECMNFDDFLQLELDEISQTVTNGDCTCVDCHADAGNPQGIFLSNDEQETFDQARKMPSILKYVELEVNGSNTVTGLRASTRIRDAGAEEGVTSCLIEVDGQLVLNNDPQVGYRHPDYVLDNQLDDNIEEFVDRTNIRTRNADCSLR